MPSFLKDSKFISDDSGIFHGFFGRKGGVSAGIYESLNCGLGSDDKRENVYENRRIIAGEAGVAEENLLSLYQVHGDSCLVVDEPFSNDDRPHADAFVTSVSGIALGIQTADCAPVLLWGESKKGPVIGAAHAGWRGAFQGILDATVREMEKLGVKKESIRASVGPCIGVSSYEVEDAFRDPFITHDPQNDHFFKASRKQEHCYFDLAGYCAKELSTAGVGKVSITGVDTYAEKENYFSYRRATHENAPDYGRQLSVIAIR